MACRPSWQENVEFKISALLPKIPEHRVILLVLSYRRCNGGRLHFSSHARIIGTALSARPTFQVPLIGKTLGACGDSIL